MFILLCIYMPMCTHILSVYICITSKFKTCHLEMEYKLLPQKVNYKVSSVQFMRLTSNMKSNMHVTTL